MFKDAEESQAWSTFFAAQCPRFVNAQAKTVPKELEVAASAADAMLEEWRKRQPSKDVATHACVAPVDEKKEEEQPSKPTKRGGRKVKAEPAEVVPAVEEPAQEEAPAEEAPKGNADYGTGDGENYR